MPILDGIEASIKLNKMMSEKKLPQTNIIGCSAFGGKDDV